MTVDAHCHLQDERLANDVENVIRRARRAGVERIICNGTSEADWEAVSRLAKRFEEIIPCFGLHPWYISNRSPQWMDLLRRMLERHPEAGCGEIGLDHAMKERNDKEQAEIFLQQTRLAAELNRPVSVHCRRAWGALQAMEREMRRLPRGFMIHAYSGSADLVQPLTRMGALFSFAGGITRPTNRRGSAALKAVPRDRLLIETDAPDTMPMTLAQSSTTLHNEPAHVILIRNVVAELLGQTPDVIDELIAGNLARLFP